MAKRNVVRKVRYNRLGSVAVKQVGHGVRCGTALFAKSALNLPCFGWVVSSRLPLLIPELLVTGKHKLFFENVFQVGQIRERKKPGQQTCKPVGHHSFQYSLINVKKAGDLKVVGSGGSP